MLYSSSRALGHQLAMATSRCHDKRKLLPGLSATICFGCVDQVCRPIRDSRVYGVTLESDEVQPSWRKEPHETASSCSAWFWHRGPVVSARATYATSMVAARVSSGRDADR